MKSGYSTCSMVITGLLDRFRNVQIRTDYPMNAEGNIQGCAKYVM
jgi:hypothetical protein